MRGAFHSFRVARWGAHLALLGLTLTLMTSCGDGTRKTVSRYEKIAQEMTIARSTPQGLPDGVREGFCGFEEYWWEIAVTVRGGKMVKIEVVEVGQEEYRTKIEPYIEAVLKAQTPAIEFPEDDLMIKGFLKAVEYSLQLGGK